MRTKANYFKIGLFVICAIVLAVAVVVVVNEKQIGESDKVLLETYIDEPVPGLGKGATVNYRGVQVGQIDRISSVASEYGIKVGTEEFSNYGRYVMITMAVNSRVVFGGTGEGDIAEAFEQLKSDGLRAQMDTQLLTGVSHIELDYFLDGDLYPELAVGSWERKNLYVPSVPSIYGSVTKSTETIAKKTSRVDIEGLAIKVDQLLDSLNRAVESVDVNAISSNMSGLLREIQETNRQLQTLLSWDVNEPVTTLPEALGDLSDALRHLNRIAITQRGDIEKIMNNMREFSMNLRELSDDLKRNPSKIFEKPVKSEVLK